MDLQEMCQRWAAAGQPDFWAITCMMRKIFASCRTQNEQKAGFAASARWHGACTYRDGFSAQMERA